MTPQRHNPLTTSDEAPARCAEGKIGFWDKASTPRIIPFALYIAFVAIADALAYAGVSDRDLRWLYPVKIALVLALLLAYRRKFVELAMPGMGLRNVMLSVLTGVIVLVLWVNLDAAWMQVGVSAGFNPAGADGRIDWLLVVVRIAGAALVVPVMEELFWRSFLLRWLTQHHFLNVYPARVGLRALAITVALFGFEHNLWLAGMVAGLAYSALYMRTGNLWSPILAHAVTNFLLGVWIVATSSWAFW